MRSRPVHLHTITSMGDVSLNLPGHDLVSAGLGDLAAGRETEAALLVAMAAGKETKPTSGTRKNDP